MEMISLGHYLNISYKSITILIKFYFDIFSFSKKIQGFFLKKSFCLIFIIFIRKIAHYSYIPLMLMI
jgi:hypothetical protein